MATTWNLTHVNCSDSQEKGLRHIVEYRSEEIRDLLSIYEPSCIFVRGAIVQADSIRCWVDTTTCTLSSHETGYVTATQTNLALSQGCLLLLAGTIQEQQEANGPLQSLSLADYYKLRDCYALSFGRLSIRFSARASASPTSILLITIDRFRTIRDQLCWWLSYEFAEHYTGRLVAIVDLSPLKSRCGPSEG